MTFGCYDKLNMLGMGNMFGMGNFYGGTNVIGQLFSGTNSIFSNGYNMFGSYGTGNCGLFMDCLGNINYDAMTGFAIGQTLLNVAGMAINEAVANKKENSIENDQNKLEKCQESLEENLEELGVKTVEEAKSYKIDAKFQTAVDTAQKEFDNVKNVEIPKYSAEISSLEEKIDILEDKGTRRTSEEEKELEILRETLKTKKENLIKLRASIEEGGSLYKKLENAKAAMDNEQDRIDGLKAQILAAQANLESAQATLKESVLAKADGTSLGRISQDKYMAKFKEENGEVTEKFAGGAEFSKRDLKRALYNYSVADDGQKELYKKQFIAIYKELAKTNPNEVKGFKDAYQYINK